jgi:hypothetical protein
MVVVVGARRASRWFRGSVFPHFASLHSGTPALDAPTRWSCGNAGAPAAFERCPMDEAPGSADDAGMARIGAGTRLIEGIDAGPRRIVAREQSSIPFGRREKGKKKEKGGKRGKEKGKGVVVIYFGAS